MAGNQKLNFGEFPPDLRGQIFGPDEAKDDDALLRLEELRLKESGLLPPAYRRSSLRKEFNKRSPRPAEGGYPIRLSGCQEIHSGD
jgi:hypothetical protein